MHCGASIDVPSARLAAFWLGVDRLLDECENRGSSRVGVQAGLYRVSWAFIARISTVYSLGLAWATRSQYTLAT